MSAKARRPETDPVAGPSVTAEIAARLAAAAAHEADTTNVHGIADTSTLVLTSDSRLTDQRTPTDASVTAAKVNGALKPSGSAATTDESLRRLGTSSTHAAAGDDSRFPTPGQKNALAGTSGTPGTANPYATEQDPRLTDQRTPLDGSVTLAKMGFDVATQVELDALAARSSAIETKAARRADPVLQLEALQQLMSNPPLVTVSPTTASTIASGVTVARTDSRLRYSPVVLVNSADGQYWMARDARQTDGSYSTTQPNAFLAQEFMHDGQLIEFGCFSNYAVGSENVLFVIDGRYVSMTFPNLGVAIDRRWVKLDLGVRDVRRVRMEMKNGHVGPLVIEPTATIWAPDVGPPLVIGFMGDSYAVGGVSYSHDSFAYSQQLAYRFGAVANTQSCKAGTGFCQSNGAFGPYSTRVVDLIAAAPDVILLQGSLNDPTNGYTTGQVATAAAALIATIQAALPHTPIFLTGILDVRHTASQSGNGAYNTALAAVAASAGVTFIDTTGWGFGTGDYLTPTGDGNCDFNLYADLIHPTVPGAKYVASRLASAIPRLPVYV